MAARNVFSSEQIEQIREGAISILSQIGVKLTRPDLVEKMRRKGYRTEGAFVQFDRPEILGKIESQKGEDVPQPRVRPFRTYASAYSHTYENRDGSYAPITNASNAAMGRFMQNTAQLWPGLGTNCPGHPVDTAPDLQFLRHAVNSFIWCKDFHSMEPVSVKIAPYQFELCAAFGKPMEGLPVYAASPLTIAGESFDILIANADKLTSAWVGSMPSLGANTPMNLVAAYAQTLAETVGGALVIEALTGIPTLYGTNLFTFDFYALTMPFGTPEKLLLEWTNAEVAGRIGGGVFNQVYSTDIHTNALRCGMQASVEKASLAMAGAMYGAQTFGCSGTLAMDELFSPVQLLLDLEMLGHIQRIMDGMPNDPFEGDLLAEVREGLKTGYIGSDRTLDNMYDYVWRAAFHTRQSFGAHLNTPVKAEVELAREKVQEIMAMPPAFYAGEDLEREAERIFGAAQKALEG